MNWKRLLFIIGILFTAFGGIDPLQGALFICIGSILLAGSTYLAEEKHWKIFFITSAMIISGVIFLFYFSSLGGFGNDSHISWWWGVLILPYPIGWLINIGTFISIFISRIKRK